MIDADPVAACVREIMAERGLWAAGGSRNSDGTSRDSTGWPKNPRALAGRLRRAQTFLRALGIDIAFSREGQAGSRIIMIRATHENIVSTDLPTIIGLMKHSALRIHESKPLALINVLAKRFPPHPIFKIQAHRLFQPSRKCITHAPCFDKPRRATA